MKKMLSILLTVALISTLSVGCTPKQKPVSSVQSSPVSTSSTSQPAQSSQPPASSSSINNQEQVLAGTGTYNGQSDTNFVEIKLDGTNNPIEFNIEEIKDSFKGLNLGQKVKLTYKISDSKQYILKSIEKAN